MNKHILQTLQYRNKTIPRGKFFWNSHLGDINWRKAWLLPHTFCISSKTKEVHFKILHKIYPVNLYIAKFLDIDSTCTFCGLVDETLTHLFFQCDVIITFWSELYSYIFQAHQSIDIFTLKDIICYYCNDNDRALCDVDNSNGKNFHSQTEIYRFFAPIFHLLY